MDTERSCDASAAEATERSLRVGGQTATGSAAAISVSRRRSDVREQRAERNAGGDTDGSHWEGTVSRRSADYRIGTAGSRRNTPRAQAVSDFVRLSDAAWHCGASRG